MRRPPQNFSAIFLMILMFHSNLFIIIKIQPPSLFIPSSTFLRQIGNSEFMNNFFLNFWPSQNILTLLVPPPPIFRPSYGPAEGGGPGQRERQNSRMRLKLCTFGKREREKKSSITVIYFKNPLFFCFTFGQFSKEKC